MTRGWGYSPTTRRTTPRTGATPDLAATSSATRSHPELNLLKPARYRGPQEIPYFVLMTEIFHSLLCPASSVGRALDFES